MSPKTPTNEGYSCPEVAIPSWSSTLILEPSHEARIHMRHPGQLSPPALAGCPNFPGQHTAHEQVIQRLLTLITEGACSRVRKSPPTQSVSSTTSVPASQPEEDFAVWWGPRAPNLKRPWHIHPSSKHCSVTGARRLGKIFLPAPSETAIHALV
jgi:hypothetical protein